MFSQHTAHTGWGISLNLQKQQKHNHSASQTHRGIVLSGRAQSDLSHSLQAAGTVRTVPAACGTATAVVVLTGKHEIAAGKQRMRHVNLKVCMPPCYDTERGCAKKLVSSKTGMSGVITGI